MFKRMDKVLLLLTLMLTVFGIIMIFSASSYSSVLEYKRAEYFFALKQIIALVPTLIISLIILKIPLKYYRRLSVIALGTILFVLVLLKSYGSISHNAQSWIGLLKDFSIQPSEFAKPIIILYLACVYGSRKGFKNKWDMLIPLVPCLIACLMVFLEPDKGTAFIIFLIIALIFFAIPVEFGPKVNFLKKISIIIICAAVGAIALNYDKLANTESETLSRFNFLKPCDRYLEDTGYQVCNGYIAINNGRFLGVGLGKSTQKYMYLPEAHTDFIFPIIVEELGLLAGIIVFIIYIIILSRILSIALKAKDLRGSIIAYGTFLYILIHIIINLGGLLALMPLTGVPLPFLSYGGSFLMNLFVLLSLTQRVKIESTSVKAG